MLPIDDVLNVGFTALNFRNLASVGASVTVALRKAVASGVLTQMPAMALFAGALLQYRDPDGARAAYQQAIDSGDSLVPSAYVSLGHLLRRQGDIDGARAAYQRAIDSGDDVYAPIEIARLGELSKRHGHVDSSGARDVGGDS